MNININIDHAVAITPPDVVPPATSVDLSDYSPDPTGATSSDAAFTAAMTAAGVDGQVDIGPGTFLISSPILPLAGQILSGDGIDSTILRLDIDNIANFPFLALIQGIAETGGGFTANPGVTVQDLTINGGRSGAVYTEAGKPPGKTTGAQVENSLYDTVSCPDGYGQGISLKYGWTVQRVRFTNINGHKCSTFSSHGATIRDCVWDNAGNDEDPAFPSTSGERDQIGGGAGVTDLLIERCVFKPDCVGSGIDITQGTRVVIRDCSVYAFSLILEGVIDFEVSGNYLGPLGGVGGTGGGGNINIKPNTQYNSSVWADYPTNTVPGAGAFQARDGVVSGNTIVASTGAPGVIINYTDNSKTGFPLYVAGGNNIIENNSIIGPLYMGVLVVGNTSGAKSDPDIIRNNRVFDVIPGTAGLGTEYNSGAGYFEACGIGISIGVDDKIYGNTVYETRSSPPEVHVIHVGGRSQSSVPFENTYVSNNIGQGTTGDVIHNAF
jgi:hypothetical protein